MAHLLDHVCKFVFLLDTETVRPNRFYILIINITCTYLIITLHKSRAPATYKTPLAPFDGYWLRGAIKNKVVAGPPPPAVPIPDQACYCHLSNCLHLASFMVLIPFKYLAHKTTCANTEVSNLVLLEHCKGV